MPNPRGASGRNPQGNLTNSGRDGAKRFFDRFSTTVIKARKAAGVQ